NTSHTDGDAFRASANTSHTDGDAFRASANTSHANGDSAASIHSTAALEETSSHSVTGASNSNAVSTTSVATKPCYTADDMKMFREKNEVQELLFVAESYLGRMLNPTDIQCLLYWYDGLHFSTDLIVYLMEYCIAKGHSSLRYMEKVALNWKDSNIETVEQAKRNVNSHSQIHFAVMKALGISGRNLVPMESAYTDKWTKEFGFGQDIIEEACRRTISVTHQPSFEYTDKILDNWHKQQIHQLSDIVSLDVAYQKSKAENKTVTKTSKAAAPNKFNNFPQRTYDLDQLEAQLLNSPNATQGGSHGTK
ncbi:MAG: DnaD domain protein, partial [Lachnospiraceae bacterium]